MEEQSESSILVAFKSQIQQYFARHKEGLLEWVAVENWDTSYSQQLLLASIKQFWSIPRTEAGRLSNAKYQKKSSNPVHI